MKFTILLLLIAACLNPSSSFAGSREGKQTYELHCEMCHGNSGQSPMADVPDFSRGEGLYNTDQNLLLRIQAGKSSCPGYDGILRKQKILDVIAYLRTFK